MDNIQEWRGIRGLVAAEVLKDTVDEFVCDTPFPVAGVAELSKTTESSSEPHHYDNKAAVVVDSTGADEVTIAASAIPLEVYAKITGQHYNKAKGMMVEGKRDNKYFAIGYITKRTDGTEVFVWRLKGKFNIPDFSHATEDDGTEANGQEITYTGIFTNHKFTDDGKTEPQRAIYVEQDINPKNEAKFFATVQTPETVEGPAQTI